MLPIDYQLRMKELLSDGYDEYFNCFGTPEYRALRLNPLKTDRAQFPAFMEDFRKELSARGSTVTFEPVEWEESGYYYFGPEDLRLGNQVYHEAGAYYIQEPSAMKPAAVLDVGPKDKVLDLCAAPGGKSTQLAGYMDGQGVLVCSEIVSSRARVLSQNIERMGIRNAVVLNETPQRLRDTFIDYFDKILVDAPCSGEGMFRKNPEAVNEWSVDNVHKCASRQDEILDCAATMLKCGGRLVYSTCTFAHEEDEDCMERFLGRHPDYKLVSMEKLFPHKVRGEGHFVASLLRRGGTSDGYCTAEAAAGRDKRSNAGKADGRLRVFDDFCRLTIRDTERMVRPDGTGVLSGSLNGRLIFFGDNLYLLPEEAPVLNGLKTMRPGLQLGSFLSGSNNRGSERFMPSHSLALALKPYEAVNAVDITLDEAAAFIEGLTLPVPDTYDLDAKGWCLVCCGNISIGWGKIAGGMIKNHYPKGLRKKLNEDRL